MIRAQVIIKTADNVAENFVSNSFAFNVDVTATAPALLTPLIKDFYDDLVTYYPTTIAQNGHEIKYTLLPGTPPNYPFDTDVWNFATAPNGVSMAEELAVCLSFQGDKEAGLPQARRRGRIYIGPLDNTSANGNRPSSAIITSLANAAASFADAVTNLGGNTWWAVWSVANQEGVPISNGWVDNAWDVQRRRGVDPTSRTTWVVT